MTWRSLSSAHRFSRACRNALLSWVGWLGSHQLMDRFADQETEVFIWISGVALPLLLAILGGLRWRDRWWILTGPIVIMLSMVGSSIYEIVMTPRGFPGFGFLIMVIYAGATMVAALCGVLLSDLRVIVTRRPTSRMLVDRTPLTASRSVQLVLGGLGLILLGLVSGAGWDVLIGLIVIFVGGVFAGWWKTWWPWWLWWP